LLHPARSLIPKGTQAIMKAIGILVFALASLSACSSDDSKGSDENTGTSCSAPAQCYPGLDAGVLKGEVQCLTRVTGGYCTHLCTADSDCCAVTGECKSGFKQVCAPFESTGLKMCFLSCEAADVKAGDPAITDDSAYCQKYANAAFGCRSTGGGSENRKVCVP
jgi:hypothetical protein